MLSIDTVIDQTLAVRQTIVKILKSIPHEQADMIPPTWHNNAHWHAGHLIVTPHLITQGLMKEPLSVPEEYRKYFAKGTDPSQWGSDAVPSFEDLADEVMPSVGRLFETLKPRIEEPYLEPYHTSVGVVLHSPLDSLNFSLAHDGIHLGMLMALKRALPQV